MAVRSGVEVTVDRVKDVLEGIVILAGHRVLVGIPAEKAFRPDSPINNAALGYIHENGAPEAGIPARAWLKPGVRESKEGWMPHLVAAARGALDGKPKLVEVELNRAGMVARNGAVTKITTGPFEPLKPATLAARRRRGRTGTRPLLDTGKMRQAVTYVVRKI